jgi:hypothetical protein
MKDRLDIQPALARIRLDECFARCIHTSTTPPNAGL